MRLKDRVAIVTGAQQGIGAAMARALAREGAAVVVNYLDDADPAQRIVDEIVAGGGNAVLAQGDVSDEDDVAALIEAAEQLGGADILVNNAGVFPRSRFLDMSLAEWDSVLAVNLRGAFLCTQAFARSVVSRSGTGSVINMSSSVAMLGSSRGVHYTTTKAGVLGFTRATALALSSHGIRVNAIAPGMVDTDQPREGLSEAEIDAIVQGIPLGRLITPSEIADAAVFLASDESRTITGQTLHVNGGALMP